MITEKILKTTNGKTKKRYIHFGLKESFQDGEVIVQHKEDYLIQKEKYQNLKEENQKLKSELQKLKESNNTHESKSLLEEIKLQKKEEVTYLKETIDKKDDLIKEHLHEIKQLNQKIEKLTEDKSESVSKFMFILSDLASDNPFERLIHNRPKQIINNMKENKELENIPIYETVLSEYTEEDKEPKSE